MTKYTDIMPIILRWIFWLMSEFEGERGKKEGREMDDKYLKLWIWNYLMKETGSLCKEGVKIYWNPISRVKQIHIQCQKPDFSIGPIFFLSISDIFTLSTFLLLLFNGLWN